MHISSIILMLIQCLPFREKMMRNTPLSFRRGQCLKQDHQQCISALLSVIYLKPW